VYVLEQTYDVRIQRTGTAVAYSLSPTNVITVTEEDGAPTGSVNKLVFSNGTVTINGNTATVEAGGSLTIEEADGAPTGTATTLVFPNGTVSLADGTATLDLSLDTLDTTGILEQLAAQIADLSGVTSSDFPNGLIGDFDQDNVVGSADLIIFIQYFGQTLASNSTERAARLSAAFANSTDGPFDGVRTINSETADREGDVNLTTAEIPEGSNLYYTDARVDVRIGAALISDLSDTPAGIGTAGQVLVVNSGRTGYEFANQPTIPDHSIYVQSVNEETPDQDGDVILTTSNISEGTNLYYTDARFDTRYATKTHYHDRYATEAEAERSGATATLEVYYTARPDGDGYAESEVSDVGETDTINRTLYYSDKFEADPDTAGDWTQYTTQPADNATFATAKAALLAGLNDTDATAETRGTLPLSLKMVRTVTTASGDLLLDTYTGAAAAYSVRKLDKDYTGYCMKVREDSGDTEADIGFDGNGGVDQSAIATHCGSANGYVVTWYDQSGNANNATQSTSGNQPQIYNGTAVITENGKPAIKPTSASQMFDFSVAASTSGVTFFSVVRIISGTNNPAFINGPNVSAYIGAAADGSTSTVIDQASGNVSYRIDEAAVTPADRNALHDALATGNHLLSIYTDATAAFTNYIGYDNQTVWMYQMQEMVTYRSDEFTGGDLSGIETDISTHFSTP
jgi:hypothetical protein